MAMNDSSDNSHIPGVKKPYEKPSFRYEQVFVTSALMCTKSGTEGQCKLGSTKSS
jgi:hypothetical protein